MFLVDGIRQNPLRKKMSSSFASFVAFILIALWFPLSGEAAESYMGSEACMECHKAQYAEWAASGHHLQLRNNEKAKASGLPLPEGYSWSDISYVIGGVNNKANYVDDQGYLITSAKNKDAAKTLYHLDSGSWSEYLPGEKKTFDCAFCHTTGYRPERHQDNLPGIVGTWEEDGIGCEACHGPASEHVINPAKKMHFGGLGAEICENCHQRGGIDYKPLIKKGLTRHHEQIDELKLGAHKGLSCLNCHNPHRKAGLAKRNCTICHSKMIDVFAKSRHGKAGIECIECHMAKVPKRAVSRVSYIGHMRTHLFKVNTDPGANMFITIEEEGLTSEFLKGFTTVDYVCLPCHESRDKQWAAKHAAGFHDK